MLSKRRTFHPFLTFPNKEILPVSLTGLFLVVMDWVNYYCHLSQCTSNSLTKKPHCHQVNDLTIPSLLNALFKALFVFYVFSSQAFSWHWSVILFFRFTNKIFFHTTTTNRSFITVKRSPYFMVKNCRKYGETVAVNSSENAVQLQTRGRFTLIFGFEL